MNSVGINPHYISDQVSNEFALVFLSVTSINYAIAAEIFNTKRSSNSYISAISNNLNIFFSANASNFIYFESETIDLFNQDKLVVELDSIKDLDFLKKRMGKLKSRQISDDETYYKFNKNFIEVNESERVGQKNSIYMDAKFIELIFDPVQILESYVVERLKLNYEEIDHFMQTWILQYCKLTEVTNLRQIIHSSVSLYNELFYEESNRKNQYIKRDRSTTISLKYFIKRLTIVVKKHISADECQRSIVLGIYLFLRFDKAFRFRYLWKKEIKKESKPILAINALKKLDPTYLYVRARGELTSIPGLNYIYKGGLLPRKEKGTINLIKGPAGIGKTTYALQLATDFAKRGRSSFYLSFEEDYEGIINKLISFNLSYNENRYVTVNLQDWKDNELKDVYEKFPGQGLLAFLSPPNGKINDLSGYIKELGVATDHQINKKSSKVLVLDGLNALVDKFKTFESQRDPRLKIGMLFQAIQNSGYICFLIAEENDPDLVFVDYLTDSVSIISRDSNFDSWITIEKSRHQPCHPGPHIFKINVEKGITIFPSLRSVLQSGSGMFRATLSTKKSIYLSEYIDDMQNYFNHPRSSSEKHNDEDVYKIREKSSTLIISDKDFYVRYLGFSLVFAPSIKYKQSDSSTYIGNKDDENNLSIPSSILIISFHRPKTKLRQFINENSKLHREYNKEDRFVYLESFATNDYLTVHELIWKIIKVIKKSRELGLPIERILFDEFNVIFSLLPQVVSQPLFWAALFDMLEKNAITTFFTFKSFSDKEPPEYLLDASDYIFKYTDNQYKAIKQPIETS